MRPCCRLASLPGASRASSAHAAAHAAPNAPMSKNTARGPPASTTDGTRSIAAAAPMYMPEVTRDTARDFSWGGVHCASTVWMAGKMRPCATPMSARATTTGSTGTARALA